MADVKIFCRRCIVSRCQNNGIHRFPRNEERKREWLNAIKYIKPRAPRKFSYICNRHFRRSDYTSANRLKLTAIPSVFSWNGGIPDDEPMPFNQNKVQLTCTKSEPEVVTFDPTKVLSTYSKTQKVFVNVNTNKTAFNNPLANKETDINMDHNVELVDMEEEMDIEVTVKKEMNTIDPLATMSQLEDDNQIIILKEEPIEDKAEQEAQNVETGKEIPKDEAIQTNPTYGFSIHCYKNDNNFVFHYTGLENIEMFMLLFKSLGDLNNIKYSIGPPPPDIDTVEQFFITLLILRTHKPFDEIAVLYKIKLHEVYNILVSWLQIIFVQWTSGDSAKGVPNLPVNEKAATSLCILNLGSKFGYVGICSNNGFVNYVFPSWLKENPIIDDFDGEGNIKDCKGNDLDAKDIFGGIKVNMSVSFKKDIVIHKQMLRQTVNHTKNMIKMMRNYKILNKPLRRVELFMPRTIVFVIAMLVSFKNNTMRGNGIARIKQ